MIIPVYLFGAIITSVIVVNLTSRGFIVPSDIEHDCITRYFIVGVTVLVWPLTIATFILFGISFIFGYLCVGIGKLASKAFS